MSMPFCEHCGGHDLARRPWVAADYKHPAYLAARRDAFNRSAGLCQFCGLRPAEEAHHWDMRYPAPEHMTGDRLTALCKECHHTATTARRAGSAVERAFSPAGDLSVEEWEMLRAAVLSVILEADPSPMTISAIRQSAKARTPHVRKVLAGLIFAGTIEEERGHSQRSFVISHGEAARMRYASEREVLAS